MVAINFCDSLKENKCKTVQQLPLNKFNGCTLKLSLKIIKLYIIRIYRKHNQDISQTIWILEWIGTRETLFVLNVISQRCLGMNQDSMTTIMASIKYDTT